MYMRIIMAWSLGTLFICFRCNVFLFVVVVVFVPSLLYAVYATVFQSVFKGGDWVGRGGGWGEVASETKWII